MSLINIELTFIFIVWLIFYLIFVSYLILKKVKQSQKSKIASDKLFSFFSDLVMNYESIQSLSREELVLKKNINLQAEYSKQNIKLSILDSLISSSNQLYYFVSPAIIFATYIYFFDISIITIGTILVFNSLFIMTSQLILQFITSIQSISGSIVDILQLEDLNNYNSFTCNEGVDIVDNSSVFCFKEKCNIVFSGISYKYDETSPYVLRDINIKIPDGQHVGIIGRNGSGKSTLLKIICGIYQASEGLYCISEELVNSGNAKFLPSIISYMGQNSSVITGTLRDNLCSFLDDVNYGVIEQSIVDAELVEFVQNRGLNFFINANRHNISAGELQRIELARLLIRQPKILILDEATSNLDEATQARIVNKLRKRNITIIQVSHRMAALKGSDCIYLLEHGSLSIIDDTNFYLG